MTHGFPRWTLCCLSLLCWRAAKGDAIYWMLDQDPRYETVHFAFAQMLNADDPTQVYVLADQATAAEAVPRTELVDSDDPIGGTGTRIDKTASYIGTDWTEASFYIELYDLSGDVVGQSSVFKFADCAKHIWTNGSALTPSSVTTFAITIPEPTGGLLVWLGAAALALRRRRETVLKKD